jgi:hypothetical protein
MQMVLTDADVVAARFVVMRLGGGEHGRRLVEFWEERTGEWAETEGYAAGGVHIAASGTHASIQDHKCPSPRGYFKRDVPVCLTAGWPTPQIFLVTRRRCIHFKPCASEPAKTCQRFY